MSYIDGVRILSLFDGMACGMLAFIGAGIDVNSYDAYEIDKFAIKTATHNFPMIREHGDVFTADFTVYEGVDFLIGGSPCTYWSIAQTKNRETVASGMGWDLFCQYVRALREAKPKYFIYENNKSMSKDIRRSIDEAFGFEAVCINSALVSAQNRKRLYWVGKRNPDGTYSKVDIEQPEDRGIMLRDILEYGVTEKAKAYCLKHQAGNARDYFKKHHTQVSFVPVCLMPVNDKNVYEVREGKITINRKQYPIKLHDGFYIIRKLTVTECMRLQTVPEWYEFPVSPTQAYKMIGNGWTVDVITHLIKSCVEDEL